MTNKNYKLKAEDIKPLAVGLGGCIATDMITVEGQPVGYMVREQSLNAADSGWCFMAGGESQEYMDDQSNHGIYDVNTIANYSPDIVPLLSAPPQSAFARDRVSGKLIPVFYEEPKE